MGSNSLAGPASNGQVFFTFCVVRLSTVVFEYRAC